MKNFRHLFVCLGTVVACTMSLSCFAQQANYSAATPQFSSVSGQSLRIGIVNTKKCLEESKLGKQEQGNFEKMKQQMESVLQEKERALEEIETKLNDEDYMDSISAEVEADLKRKRRSIRQDGLQLQNQYLQTLQQANVKIVQKITDAISKASNQVAKESASNGDAGLDAIFTDEACTFYNPKLDVTDRVVAKMNQLFETEAKDRSNSPSSTR